MTIANEMLKLKNNLSASYTACKEKGADLPENKNFDNLADCISSLATTNNTQTFVVPTTEQQILNAPAGYAGFNRVTVLAVTSAIDENITPNNIVEGVTILGVEGTQEGMKPTTLNITPTTYSQQHTPQSPYNGFNSVNVAAVTSAIDSQITANNIKAGVSILGVEGTVIESKTQSITITSNGTYAPQDTYTGYDNVKVEINTINNQNLTVSPTTSEQNFTPTSPKTGFGTVKVRAVTSSIDSNIKANNIKSGVSILGVNGTVTELKGETKTVSPLATAQTITPSTGYNGLTSVKINAVSANVDSNIQAGNIKAGVTILGVSGTVTELVGETIKITSNGTYTPSTGNGFTNVSVSVSGSSPTLISRTFTSNGTYAATSYNADGFSSVQISVVPSGTYTITTNGTYNVSNYATAEVSVDNDATFYKSCLDSITSVLNTKGITTTGNYEGLPQIIDTSYNLILYQLNTITGNS